MGVRIGWDGGVGCRRIRGEAPGAMKLVARAADVWLPEKLAILLASMAEALEHDPEKWTPVFEKIMLQEQVRAG
jgi:hypothetical protein